MNRAIYFAFGIVLLSLIGSTCISVVYVHGQQNYYPTVTKVYTSLPIILTINLYNTTPTKNVGVGGTEVRFYFDGMFIGSSFASSSRFSLGVASISIYTTPVYHSLYYVIEKPRYGNYTSLVSTFVYSPPGYPP